MMPQVYAEMANEQAKQLFDGYQKASDLGRDWGKLAGVFKVQDWPGVLQVGQLAAFKSRYTAQMRDMASCGLASMKTGLPLFKLYEREKQALIPQGLRGANFRKTVPGLLRVSDLLG